MEQLLHTTEGVRDIYHEKKKKKAGTSEPTS